jgi:L-threonylcarbamoyladenylate synthase
MGRAAGRVGWALLVYSCRVERLTISPVDPDPRVLARAADVLLAGGLVAFPTDTFYGLAADPRQENAVERVFRAKGRSSLLALPLIAADISQVHAAATRISVLTLRLAERFWPGPLTLVADASPSIVAAVHGGTGTIAVRVPDHPAARQFAGYVGFPIISTSANRSGDPAVGTADAVVAGIGDLLDLVLDGGSTPGAAPSTIVDARGPLAVLIRAGAVPFSLILEAS